jgi:hypothetical protein
MKPRGLHSIAVSSCAVLLVLQGRQTVARETPYDPDVARALLDVFPKLQSNAEPRFAIPLPVIKRWIASQLNAAFDPVSDAPLDHLLQEWQALVTVKEGHPTVELVMKVRVFRASPVNLVEVMLFPEETIYESVTMNGDDVTPLQEKGWSTLVISRPGEYVIRTKVKMKAQEDGDRRFLQLHVDRFVVPSVHFDSEAALAVSLSGVTQGLRGTVAAGTHGVLTSGRQRVFKLSWEPIRKVLIRRGTLTVDPSIAWRVQDRILSANARLMIRVQGGQRQEVELILPPGADNVTASGADVRQVRVEGRRVILHFTHALGGRTAVNLRFDVPRSKGNVIRLPDVVPVDGRVGSHGWVIVTDDAQGQIFEQSRAGMRAASDIELPKEAAGLAVGEPILVYERTSRTSSVLLDHVASTPFALVDTIADTAEVVVLIRESGAQMTRVRYMIRNNKSQFLKMTLPASVRLLSIKVDGKDSYASRDGARTLIPLVRSIQSLGGLVSFPVEVVYLSTGPVFEAGTARRVDLPELEGVSTASITVKAWCPDGLHLGGVESRLEQVKQFRAGTASLTLSYPSLTPNTLPKGTPASSATINAQAVAPNQEAFENTLGLNYWSAGYEAYRANRLEEAETLLANAAKYSKDATITGNASKLLGNIRLGRGEGLENQTRAQKAQTKNIQQSLQVDNNLLEVQQEELIDQGLALIQQGKEELGAELLEEADRVTAELGGRGSSSGKQRAQAHRYKKIQAKVQEDQKRNRSLKVELKQLQEQAEVITSKRDAHSLIFSDELAKVSEKFQLTERELQDAAF